MLELEPKQSHRVKRQALADAARESCDLDGVLSGLGLDNLTHLGDDVALLLLCRESAVA